THRRPEHEHCRRRNVHGRRQSLPPYRLTRIYLFASHSRSGSAMSQRSALSIFLAFSSASLLLLTSCAGTSGPPTAAPSAQDIIGTYIEIARASYGDSLATARALDAAIAALLANPSQATLAAARAAWREARIPYQQTEAYRFGNPVVDEWEGRVNAWPLDEGLID